MPPDEPPQPPRGVSSSTTAGITSGASGALPRLPMFSRLSDVLLGTGNTNSITTESTKQLQSASARPLSGGGAAAPLPPAAADEAASKVTDGPTLGSTSRSSILDGAEDPSALQQPSVASSSLPLAGIWLKGPAARSAELCKYFGLPAKEMFLDDYNCALRKKVVLQGRMYIFDHYVCFSSFLFGFAKKVVIPLEHVTSVRKKTNLRIPNSIKIEVAATPGCTSNQYFFTSFLSREDAFQLINNCWMQSRSRVQQEPSSPGADSLSFADTLGGGSALVTDSTLAAARQLTQATTTDPNSVPGCGAVDDDEDEDEEGDAVSDRVWAALTQGPVPPPHHDSHVVVQAVLEGTAKDFYDLLLADNSHMLEDFLDTQGSRRMCLSRWKNESLLGHVRDFQFVSPIKGAFSNWGVPHTECLQSHRLRRFEGDHLVFESSQTMTNIPYGDCFTVDMRWDIAPIAPPPPAGDALQLQLPALPPGGGAAGGGGSPFVDVGAGQQQLEVELPDSMQPGPQMQLTIRARVPFSRKCLFKKVIESGAVKQVKDTYSLLVDQLGGQLEQMARDRQPVHLGAPPSTSRLTPHGTSSLRLFGNQAQQHDPQQQQQQQANGGEAGGNGNGMSRASSGTNIMLGGSGRQHGTAANGSMMRHVPSGLSMGRFAAGSTTTSGGPDDSSLDPHSARRGRTWHEHLRRSSVANLRSLVYTLLTPVADVGGVLVERLGSMVMGGPPEASSTLASGGAPGGQSPSKGSSRGGGHHHHHHQSQSHHNHHNHHAQQQWQGGAASWHWKPVVLALLVLLVVQLLVLHTTLQQQHRQQQHYHQLATHDGSLSPSSFSDAASGAGPGPGTQADASGLDAFMAATRDIWARRIQLLEAELQLVLHHTQTLQEQLRMAQAYAAAHQQDGSGGGGGSIVNPNGAG